MVKVGGVLWLCISSLILLSVFSRKPEVICKGGLFIFLIKWMNSFV